MNAVIAVNISITFRLLVWLSWEVLTSQVYQLSFLLVCNRLNSCGLHQQIIVFFFFYLKSMSLLGSSNSGSSRDHWLAAGWLGLCCLKPFVAPDSMSAGEWGWGWVGSCFLLSTGSLAHSYSRDQNFSGAASSGMPQLMSPSPFSVSITFRLIHSGHMTKTTSQCSKTIPEGRIKGWIIVVTFANSFLYSLGDKVAREMVYLCIHLFSNLSISKYFLRVLSSRDILVNIKDMQPVAYRLKLLASSSPVRKLHLTYPTTYKRL